MASRHVRFLMSIPVSLRLGVLTAACFLPGTIPTTPAADPAVEDLKARVAQLEAENKALRERLAKLEGGKSPAPPAAKPLKLTVVPGGWGDADPDDIKAVCRSVVAELSPYFANRELDPISIRHDAKQGPMVVFGKGAGGERRVLLNVKDSYWSQFAFQFAHEFCHILCNYREANPANLWFEEALCETSSLFVLRRLAQTWKTRPPYPNWKSQASALHKYAAERQKQADKLDGLTFTQWYQRHALDLRKTAWDRKKNLTVAVALLPLLESKPQHWQAVGFLNQGDPRKELSFRDYLRDWHERVPKEHQPFVADVARLFEISLK